MKLLAKTNRSYIYFSIVTYLFVAIAFYLVVQYVIYQDVEERLKVERKDFENFIDVHGVWEESCYFVENKIELREVTDTLRPVPAFKDTIFFNRYDQEYVPFREHSFYASIGPHPYKVSIRKSLIESNKLLSFITASMLLLLSVGLFLLYLWQSRISKKAWAPFYDTLTKAKNYDVAKGEGMTIRQQEIFEFNELNVVLARMTEKISKDYQNLKEFTENAAHEIQTPLALINSRVEELIQEKNFSEKQMYWVQEIHRSTMRLSKLHQALLLLSKIENRQFIEVEPTDLVQVARKKLGELEEVIQHKNLHIKVGGDGFIVRINPLLAEILINNLLNNAIRHNREGGEIAIVTTDAAFSITNTGADLTFDPQRLFERFKKQNQSSGSLGLGLAIVKKICETCGLEIDYNYAAGFHTITIVKPQP